MNEPFLEIDHAIAITGLACRLPGAPNPAAFWRLLRDGAHAIIETPAHRWASVSPAHRRRSASDQPALRYGGFLDDIESFDPGFFGISPREALAMDPQQRLMLELSWEVLEDAGIVPEALRDSRTGVFVGAMWDDYTSLLHEYGTDAITAHTLTGSNRGIIANRVSYTLGLHGPSLTVDGAQSSSLVAVHLACESLRTGESTLALAGGVNLNILRDSTVAAARFGGLSPDGRCFTFDARANGYVRGEGGGIVALKTLSHALTDGDRIYAVIKGSAVNNDGATDSLTVPSSLAQQDVLRRAYERAGVEPDAAQYVELHGTGTKVGDPIEAAALGHALGRARRADAPLLVGSAKTNVGHLEGAAGIVGLLKTVLSIEHKLLPPSLNFDTVNPSIPLAELNLEVNAVARAWPDTDRQLIAGVSSFGMGGTNCHLVLTQAPPAGGGEATQGSTTAPGESCDESTANDTGPLAYPISAKTDQALSMQAAQLESFVRENPQLSLPDLGFALATTRTGFPRRAVVIAENATALRKGVHALSRGEPANTLFQGTASAVSAETNEVATAVFMFTGQGSQRPGMGRELSCVFPVFTKALDEVCVHLDAHLDRPLREVMFAPAGTPEADLLSRTDFTQPALFAIEVALFRLVQSFGLHPGALIGHSVGEITAAHLAGVLSLGDASALIAARGRLMQSVSADGAMFAVEAAVADVAASLAGHEQDLSVAAVNSPRSTVISGTADVAIRVAEQWRARGHRIKRLAVSHAFHSPQMDSILDDFRRVAAELTYHQPSIAIVSNITGRLADNRELCSPDYWVHHARHPVQFSAGLNCLYSQGFTTYLELGPDATLATMGRAALIGHDPAPVMISTLRRGKSEPDTLLAALGRAYVHGLPVDWATRCAERGGRRISLPTYPFQRQRYWPGPRQHQPNEVLDDVASLGMDSAEHPLLGAVINVRKSGDLLVTGQLSLDAQPWLADHRIDDVALVPAAMWIDLALHAGARVDCGELAELLIKVPLVLNPHRKVRFELTLDGADAAGRRAIGIYSQPRDASADEPWTCHAHGSLERPRTTDDEPIPDLVQWPVPGAEAVSLADFYERLAEAGYRYGSAFTGLRQLWRRGADLFADVALDEERQVEGYGVYPALLDAALHAVLLGSIPDPDRIRVPYSCHGVTIRATGATRLRVRITQTGTDTVALLAADSAGQPVIRIDALRMRRASRRRFTVPTASSVPREVVRTARRAARNSETKSGLALRVAGLSQTEGEKLLLELVVSHAATVLGYDKPDDIDPQRSFKDQGFDSMTEVELCNRLAETTNQQLPSSLIFNYPNPAALARHLRGLAMNIPAPEHVAPAVTGTDTEPVAIVGVGCRFPGMVANAADLWRVVIEGVDATSSAPDERGWRVDELYDPDPERAGTISVRRGGFLENVSDFDREFFDISAREAMAMDPQQRLLLEVAWETLEDAGIVPSSLRGSDTGVFVGVTTNGYERSLPADLEGYLLTGSTGSVASGRIAYCFGLEGPAVTLDTACSSSLVALHQARRAIEAGDCAMALAGGVTVMANPDMLIDFSRLRALSPDGRCRAFSADADGVGLGEGAGMVLLERVSEARRNGHQVLAVIRGSAINQDGASNGLTAPNGTSQERLIRAALAGAGLTESDVDVVEAHGTGTLLGDPVEAHALMATYGRHGRREHPLWVGSVKSNIGHAQAAAGVAGVIKMIEAIRHGVLPPTLYATTPTPHVNWETGALRLLAEPLPWPENGHPRRAGISSFGVSGTNAHLIIEQAPPTADRPADGKTREDDSPPVVPWPISAKSVAALREQATRLRSLLTEDPGLDVADVGFSLATTRAIFDHRAVILGRDREEFRQGLDALATGGSATGLVCGAGAGNRGRTVFVFPGQGSEWAAMGRELLASSPVFRAQMLRCARALEPWTDWSLLDVIRGVDGAASLDAVDVLHPALFAMMVSLAATWQGFGVSPDAVVGTSQGEIAAACVAGALSLDEAARIVALRAKTLARLAGQGGLASVTRSLDEVRSRLSQWEGRVAVAGITGPTAITVAGDRVALGEFITACAADGLYVRRIALVPAHSAQVDVLRGELMTAFGHIAPHLAELPFYSSVTGQPFDTNGLDAEYWYSNLREPVNFRAATRALGADGHRIFLEMSPQPVLALAIHATFEESGAAADSVVTVGSLRRNAGGIAQLLASVSEAYVHGATVDWSKAFPETGRRRISLPTYPFQRQPYWLAPGTRQRSTGGVETLHPILDTITELAGGEGYLCTGSLSALRQPWLVDHTVAGAVVLPGTGLLELALRAGAETGYPMVEELTIHSPVLVPTGDELTLQLRVAAADDSGRRGLSVYTRNAQATGEWTHHATGALVRDAETGDRRVPGPWPPEGAEALDVAELYSSFAECGIGYGPAFHGIRAAWTRAGELFAELALPIENQSEASYFGVHPALLDAAMQVCLAIELTDRDEGDPGNLFMPFTFTGVRLHTCGVTAVRVHVRRTGPATTTARLTDESGATVADVEAMTVRPILARDFQRAHTAADQWLFELNWIPLSAGISQTTLNRCAVVCDNESTDFPTAELGADGYPDLAAAHAAIRGNGPDTPSFVLLPCLSRHRDVSARDTARATYAATRRVLALIQDWLDDPAPTPLVVLTRGAVAAVSEDVAVDLIHAPLWGLIRSAQEEHPGRFVAIDIDDDPASIHALLPAVGNALSAKEFQLAIRRGSTYIPRLARTAAPERATVGNEADSNDTVLITGGTGALGRILSRHLVINCGKRQLILASRRGPHAPAIAELQADLGGHGATVRVAACDAADRAALARLLDSIPLEHPLTAIIHAATTFDDVPITELTEENLENVMRPKVDAVLNLHELTQQLPLTAFVLFSSLQGILGGPGRAGYAAANTFLDAMARYRLNHGQPAMSIAWGWWAVRSAAQGLLTAPQLERTVQFLEPLGAEQGMALFDLTQRAGKALLVAARIDLTTATTPETVPAPLRGLLPAAPAAGSAEPIALESVLAQLTEDEQHTHLVEMVVTTAAAVVGVPTAAVPADRAFRDLGLDSLMAVQLRQRLAKATGLRLRATVAFDHPTANALARHLRAVLLPGQPVPPAGISRHNDRTVAAADQFDVLDAASLVDLALGRQSSPDQRRR